MNSEEMKKIQHRKMKVGSTAQDANSETGQVLSNKIK